MVCACVCVCVCVTTNMLSSTLMQLEERKQMFTNENQSRLYICINYNACGKVMHAKCCSLDQKPEYTLIQVQTITGSTVKKNN